MYGSIWASMHWVRQCFPEALKRERERGVCVREKSALSWYRESRIKKSEETDQIEILKNFKITKRLRLGWYNFPSAHGQLFSSFWWQKPKAAAANKVHSICSPYDLFSKWTLNPNAIWLQLLNCAQVETKKRRHAKAGLRALAKQSSTAIVQLM